MYKEVRFADYNSNHVHTIKPVPEGFILPRIGDYVSFEKEGRDWVVTTVHHNYEDGDILIFIDHYNNYHDLLTRMDGK